MSERRVDDPLTGVAELRGLLDSPQPPTVIDVRFRLGGPGCHRDYLAGHIPGAVFLDVDTELCGPPGPGGRHPLPDPPALQAVLRRAGVRADTPVVCYDGGDGWAASRLWWTLRWAGHPRVRVLDGGWPAWLAAGSPVETGGRTPPPGDLVVRPGGMPLLDADAAAALPGTGVLLDVRAAVRYRGEHEPIDPVAGHVPGARNLPVTDLDGPDGLLLPAARLREVLAAAGVPDGATVGAYCGSGIAAARAVLALTRAGVADPALYVGSWSNWVADGDRPIAVGDGAVVTPESESADEVTR